MVDALPKIAPAKPYRRTDDPDKPWINVHADMQRLERKIQMVKIRPPKRKEHHPYVFNDLRPYLDAKTASFLVYLPEICSKSYYVRQLAAGLCDPWVDLDMSCTLLPKVPSTGHLVNMAAHHTKKTSTPRDLPPREGSTMLPKFPVVTVLPDELQNRDIWYSDVPTIRQEVKRLKAIDEEKNKLDEDYKRTTQDFYRMNLDRLDMIKPANRERIYRTYSAYLQNTPGSKKAIQDCIAKMRK